MADIFLHDTYIVWNWALSLILLLAVIVLVLGRCRAHQVSVLSIRTDTFRSWPIVSIAGLMGMAASARETGFNRVGGLTAIAIIASATIEERNAVCSRFA